MSDIYKYDTDEILSPDEEVIHEQNKTIERLQEQLKIATKALEDIRVRSQRDWDEYDCCLWAIKAQKDIEEVK